MLSVHLVTHNLHGVTVSGGSVTVTGVGHTVGEECVGISGASSGNLKSCIGASALKMVVSSSTTGSGGAASRGVGVSVL